ncbi:plasmid stabilization system protein ParE [Prosthecobacter fusiformis]|uniref:Plasmid stabilization system protein ParE n=1 Tax=Prosthecobacter fusiformis TaxID=48464 RepID=A0A4R7S3M8_9BACT|nr:type II toxin-antitoxin system RelE/ParE family toxin [Prosthecobacter fusiformis]TDU72931.1 plasmid stabilization system protein ParE [Prosthecobacter fusiformis]
MKVVLEEDAKQDLRESFHFYEENETGAGWYFLEKIQEEIRSLGQIGGIHRKRHGFHFYASRRFPHGVFYQVEHDTVKIAAILDSRRHPSLLQDILRTR